MTRLPKRRSCRSLLQSRGFKPLNIKPTEKRPGDLVLTSRGVETVK